MEKVIGVLFNIDESLDKQNKLNALKNANIQPTLSSLSPISLVTGNSKATIDVDTQALSADSSTLSFTGSVLSCQKNYVLASQLSDKHIKFTTIGPNISITNNVIDGVDSTYSDGAGVTKDSSNKFTCDTADGQLGTAKIGTHFSITGGVLSLNAGSAYNSLVTATSNISAADPRPKFPNAGWQFSVGYNATAGQYSLYGGIRVSTVETDSVVKPIVTGLSNIDGRKDLSLAVKRMSATVDAPIQLYNGSLTSMNGSVGSATMPIYVENGSFKAISGLSGSNRTTLYITPSGTIRESSHVIGSPEYGIYMENGTLKACEPGFCMSYYARESASSSLKYLGFGAFANPDGVADTTVYSTSSRNDKTLYETAMAAGITTFIFRAAYNNNEMINPSFSTVYLYVPIDKMKQGTIYTYTIIWPDKVFDASYHKPDLYTGNTLAAGNKLNMTFYTEGTSTYLYRVWNDAKTSNEYKSYFTLFGFTPIFDIGDSIGTPGKTFSTTQSTTYTIRQGISKADNYIGDDVRMNHYTIQFMRGTNIGNTPVIYLVGFNTDNE